MDGYFHEIEENASFVWMVCFHNCDQVFLAMPKVITAVLLKVKYSGKLYFVEYY